MGGLGMEIPDNRFYSEYHLWVKVEQEHAVIGITEYAKEELGQVDYVELPPPDDYLTKNEPFGIIETSKAVTDLIAPISGAVLETNPDVADSPDVVTDDPYASGWLIKVIPSNREDLAELMKASEYEKLVRTLIESRAD
jgi:glycine cleavage system H protein